MPESYATDQSQAYNNTTYDNYSNDYNSNYTTPDTHSYNAYSSPAQTSSTPEIDTEALTMSIAADYAAASFGVSMGNNEAENSTSTQTGDSSVDAIARAASEAIASIRVATDPSEVSEQVNSLKAFAENIKANHNTPEMKELGDTIDKFVSIAMKSTKVQEAVKTTKTALNLPLRFHSHQKPIVPPQKLLSRPQKLWLLVERLILNHLAVLILII